MSELASCIRIHGYLDWFRRDIFIMLLVVWENLIPKSRGSKIVNTIAFEQNVRGFHFSSHCRTFLNRQQLNGYMFPTYHSASKKVA